jgi:sugar fermentation stimulation protein A
VKFPTLTKGALQSRYKRFLADVELEGEKTVVQAHCPNTGAMTGCQSPNAPVWLSHHANPRRKLPWTWELVQTGAGLACIHSALANRVVEEALLNGLLPDLFSPSEVLCREVPLGQDSRVDFFVPSGEGVYIEVKSVTLHRGQGEGAFPDTVSRRATKHLHELHAALRRGHRSALVFCVMHEGICRVLPAADIDPVYAEQLLDVMACGLEVYVLFNDITTDGIYPRAMTKLDSFSI